MSEIVGISAEDAGEIACGTSWEDEDGKVEFVAEQEVSRHRWYTRRLIVFKRDGVLLGFYYDDPATELQECQDRFDSDPVRVFPVVAKEIATTVYEVAA